MTDGPKLIVPGGRLVVSLTDLIEDYDGIVDACRAQRIAMGVTQLEMDDLAKFPSGYCGKLESFRGGEGRTASAKALPLWFAATGLRLARVYVEPVEVEGPRRTPVELARRPRWSDEVVEIRPQLRNLRRTSNRRPGEPRAKPQMGLLDDDEP